MLIAHKTALDPANAQATDVARACGTAQAAYNETLAEWRRHDAARKADPTFPAPSDELGWFLVGSTSADMRQ